MEQANDIKNLKLTLGIYIFIFVMKLVVYFLSGVMVLFAEALHTLSDIFISGFLLVALLYSRRKADATHMFGYGRAQYVAALVAATLFISFTSFELYREAIPGLFQPQEVEFRNLNLVFGVLALSMIIAAAPLVKLFTQKKRGAAAKAQLTELVNDELGLLAALVGSVFVILGYPIADPLASILIATIIAYNAIRLFRENTSYLLGRSPGDDYLARVEKLVYSVPGVLGVHGLRAEYIGPEIVHAGMHVEVMEGTPIEEADRIAHEVERRVHEEMEAGFCVVHVDPVRGEVTHVADDQKEVNSAGKIIYTLPGVTDRSGVEGNNQENLETDR